MGYVRFVVGVLCLVLTLLLGGLLVAATVVPAVTGWSRVAIVSGSMAPGIRPGDVVLADPDVEHPVAVGTVLVFADPNRPGLVTHRVIEARPEGTYRTKGDANQTADSSLITRDRVAGQARVLVPLLGLATAWRAQGHAYLVLPAGALVAAAVFATRYGVLNRYDPWSAPRPVTRRRPTATARIRTVTAAAALVSLVVVTAGLVAPGVARAAYTASTTNAGSYLALNPSYYLKTSSTSNTTSSTVLPLSSTAPTLTTLYNYDTNRDSSPGLLLGKSGVGLSETDSTKVQKWRLAVTSPLTLSGNTKVRLWSAIKSFDSSKMGSVQVGLFDCTSTGGSCTQIAAQTVTSTASWSAGSTTWVAKDWNFGSISRTVAAGRSLEIRAVVLGASGDDMLFAYDTTAYPSVLTVG